MASRTLRDYPKFNELLILKANKLNNEEYATMSSNTIKFANENLSPQSYWEKLIEFYTQFIKSEQ